MENGNATQPEYVHTPRLSGQLFQYGNVHLVRIYPETAIERQIFRPPGGFRHPESDEKHPIHIDITDATGNLPKLHQTFHHAENKV